MAKRIPTTRLVSELQARGMFVSKVPPKKSGVTIKVDDKRWNGTSFKFGVISCTHLGSKYQQLTHLTSFYHEAKRQGVTTMLHCGDLTDGEKMYRGQEYELFMHGADSQRDYAIKNFPKVAGMQTIVIAGNHDLSFYKTAGYNIVRAICDRRPDMQYAGDYFAKTKFGKIRVATMHADGGVP